MSEFENLVTITLDKERHLRLTLRGMVEFEKFTGRSLLKGFKIEDLSLADVAALMQACLIHEDKELTYENVLDMVDVKNMKSLVAAIVACINQSLPEATEKAPLAVKRPRG